MRIKSTLENVITKKHFILIKIKLNPGFPKTLENSIKWKQKSIYFIKNKKVFIRTTTKIKSENKK